MWAGSQEQREWYFAQKRGVELQIDSHGFHYWRPKSRGLLISIVFAFFGLFESVELPSVSTLPSRPQQEQRRLNKRPATHADIQRCAYFKWDRAGRPPHGALDFWLAAERELASGVVIPVAPPLDIIVC